MLNNLKELSIHKGKFKDLSFIKELKEFEKLSLRGCTIESMDGIEYLSNLKRLEFDHTKIKIIDKIKESKSLKEIEY